jgi:hypothetical protein
MSRNKEEKKITGKTEKFSDIGKSLTTDKLDTTSPGPRVGL